MKLTVVIPCFNEVTTIQQVVDAVRQSPVKNSEIIIVDDGSTDGTREILKQAIAPQVDQVIYHPFN